MVGIPDTCRLCNSTKNQTISISEFLKKINSFFPITGLSNTIVDLEEDIFGNKICHSCLLDVALLEDLVNKYKDLSPLPEDDKCYLCLKENVRFKVTGDLYNPIRAIEESLTMKDILPRNINSHVWKKMKKTLNNRKICCECYFLIDSASDLYQRIKEIDNDIKVAVLRAKDMDENSDNEISSSDDGIESDDFDESVLDYLEDDSEIEESDDLNNTEELIEGSEVSDRDVREFMLFMEEIKDESDSVLSTDSDDSSESMLTDSEASSQSGTINSGLDDALENISDEIDEDDSDSFDLHRAKRIKRDSDLDM